MEITPTHPQSRRAQPDQRLRHRTGFQRVPAVLLRQLSRITLTLLLGLTMATPAAAAPAAGALQQRLQAWPQWTLPAPLERPGRDDLIYPDWFAGRWQVHSHDDPTPAGSGAELIYSVRFLRDPQGRVVGDRAYNASAVGRAALGERLLRVRNDPRNPNRQIALLADDLQLESTVIGRRSAVPDADTLLAAELSLQVLHRSGEGGGDPRVSRVETLSRYRRQDDDRILGEQWQASYGSPSEGLAASAQRSWHGTLVLERELEPAADTGAGPTS